MVNLNDVYLLLCVADSGSMQAAAKKLKLSRTTLRRRLATFEADLGVPLLLRGSTGIALTAAGEVVVRRGRELHDEGERMLAEAKAAENEGDALIRLVVPVGVPNATRVRAVSMLRRLAPKVRLHVREVEDPLEAADIPHDLMVHFGGQPARGGWFSHVLRREPLRVVASSAYLREAGTPEGPADLARHRILSWRTAGDDGSNWPLASGGRVEVTPWVCSANQSLLLDLARQGEGLYLGPVSDEELGDLVVILDGVVEDQVTLRMSSPHSSSSDSRVRVLLNNIRALISQASPG